MKQKDIIIIIAVVGVSALLAVVVSKVVIKSGDKKQEVEVVQAITPNFPTPDARYFNPQSYDPTQPITIGDNVNPDPFKGTPGQ
jgi:hypothetical protein